VRQKVPGIQVALFRNGTTTLMVDVAEKMARALTGLDDNAKYAAFVAAARKHGIKLILTVAVEEPE
jgi:hypothetical protein